MPIDLASRVRKAADQVSCDLNGEVAILNLKSTLYFGLGQVGATIWDALSETKPAAELCQVVFDRYDVDEARCRQDVLAFLGKLEQAGLVEVVG